MRLARKLASLAEVARARLILKSLPLPVALSRNSSPATTSRVSAPAGEDPLEFLAWAAAKIPGSTCLPRAFAAQRILARHGRHSVIVFGVRRRADGSLDAHAWVEENGQVVCGDVPDLAGYARLTPEQWRV